MSKRSGLGRGLDALIPAGSQDNSSGTGNLEVEIKSIQPNPRQPRTNLDPEQLRDLTESIRIHGVLQPLVVLPPDSRGHYTLIAGERRLRASKLAGLEVVPVVIRDTNAQGQLELALIENLQRSDLNPLEAAEGYRQLADDFNLSHEAIADQVGKSRATISNTLRLLKLSAAVREALTDEKISEGHARALLALHTAQSQSAALETILQRSLNVRQTEELVRRLQGEPRKKKTERVRPAEETALEEQLQESLGTRVSLRRGTKGGSIVIRFFSDEELNTLVDRLLDEG
ncbi:MAG: ParB/RepB/Spo0J family partition protein [Anaerolineales bacterium]|nr:MAG: ParB/RepB/Spo0J family partition protein [Anaerolineales bacterium]